MAEDLCISEKLRKEVSRLYYNSYSYTGLQMMAQRDRSSTSEAKETDSLGLPALTDTNPYDSNREPIGNQQTDNEPVADQLREHLKRLKQ